MSYFPKDIMDVAANVFLEMGTVGVDYYTDEEREANIEAIATVILAERKRCERVVEALKPFAGLGEEFLTELSKRARPDDVPVWGYNDHSLTYGDFRKANAVFAAYKATQGEAS